MGHALALAILLALGACGRDGFAPAPRPQQTPEDMTPDPFGPPDDTKAPLRLTTPRLVVEADEGPGETWDVQLQALMRVDERFLAVWHQNISGRIQLRAGFVGPEGLLAPAFDVSLDHEDLESVDGASRAHWNGLTLIFFWSVEGVIKMRDFDASGAPITAPRAIIDTNRRLSPIYGLEPTDTGFLMVLEGRGSERVLHALDRAGRSLGERVLEPPDEQGRLSSLRWSDTRTTLAWSIRRAGDIDEVWHEVLDGPRRMIYTAEHATGRLATLTHPSPESDYMSIFDWDRGWSLYDVGPQSEREVLFIESNHGISPLETPGGRFGMLGGVGPAFELSEFLRFRAYDASFQPLGEVDVRESDNARGCIEYFAFAPGLGAFGLMWQRGCGQERQIYFATVPYDGID